MVERTQQLSINPFTLLFHFKLFAHSLPFPSSAKLNTRSDYREESSPQVKKEEPKSAFKNLIERTRLGHLLLKMSYLKSAPEGLKESEVERGSRNRRPPIPYIPVVDHLQESVLTKNATLKIKLKDHTEFSVKIWHSGTPEAFLQHVQQALSACRRKGFFAAYDDAEDAESNLQDQRRVLRTAIANQKEAKGKSSTPEESERKAALVEISAKLKKAQTEKRAVAEEIFSLYGNLLGEESKFQWEQIVSKQIDCHPWYDLNGISHDEPREKSHDSFRDCTSFHMLTVFSQDAAEAQRFYISNVLKKPQRVPVRHFFSRVEQLNSYLAHLPCLYYSPKANAGTKAVNPYDDAELANHVLRMCPIAWQNQYELTQDSVPESMRALLPILETIEKCTEFTKDKPKSGSSAEKPPKDKRKMDHSGTGRIPKSPNPTSTVPFARRMGRAHYPQYDGVSQVPQGRKSQKRNSSQIHKQALQKGRIFFRPTF